MMLPHAKRTQLVKYILGKPTLTSRRLLQLATVPHGSQWNHITPCKHGHWYTLEKQQPVEQSDVVILYIHGGGFRVGHSTMYSDSFLHILRRLEKTHDVKAAVLSLEYGLVPEHTWNDQMDQAQAAYLYLLELGLPASKIIIGGDSAGGHITGMLLPRLRTKGIELPLGAMMISPLVTFDQTSPSFTAHSSFDCLPDAIITQDLKQVFPDDKQSPIHANMTHMPPILVSFGQRERFANDIEKYIARLEQQGVDVHVVSRHNQPHVYVVTPLLASSLRVWAKDCSLLADWCSQRVKQSDAY
ncbi:Alpha/Beta hydrolase protein [Chlamydoabsidia padenii]|nr:Alpha/Beta hydrolase protein [Chlamydoabsidia padenii]